MDNKELYTLIMEQKARIDALEKELEETKKTSFDAIKDLGSAMGNHMPDLKGIGASIASKLPSFSISFKKKDQ